MSKTIRIISQTVFSGTTYRLGDVLEVSDAVAEALVARGNAAASGNLVQGISYDSSVSKTRPNDTSAYAALDVLSDSASAGSLWRFDGIAPAGGGKIALYRATLRIDVAAIPSGMGNFRLHLYTSQPTILNDNDAFDLPSGDRTKYVGFIEIPTPLDLGSTLWADTASQGYPFTLPITAASSTLWGHLQTVNGYTPTASAVKTVTIYATVP